MLTIIGFICTNLEDQKKTRYWVKEKVQNSPEIYLHVNKKQNDYQNCKLNHFSHLWLEIAHFFILYDLGAETNISDVYCSSSDL